jgi:hypothetical protein
VSLVPLHATTIVLDPTLLHSHLPFQADSSLLHIPSTHSQLSLLHSLSFVAKAWPSFLATSAAYPPSLTYIHATLDTADLLHIPALVAVHPVYGDEPEGEATTAATIATR